MGITFSSLWYLGGRAVEQLLRFIPSTSPPRPSLPDDVVFDILSRVPAKPLCRFRCVSRGWRALISDPVFVAAQRSGPAEPFLVVGSPSESCLRLVASSGNSVVARVIDQTSHGWTPVCNSPVDDVLCVTGYADGAPVAGIIDLATMKELVIPLESDRAWACGRAVPSGAYKAVRFNSSLECEVLTLGAGGDHGDHRWRKRKSFRFRTDHYSRDNYTAAVNGTLHFMAVALPDAAGSVLRFDLESEEWKCRIKGPPDVKLGRPEISLGELNGSLCMVEPDHSGCTNIWMLTTDSDSDESMWVKAYEIPLDPSTYYQMMPLRVLEGGRKLLLCNNKLGGAPVLQIYDHYNGTFTDAVKELLGDQVSGIGFCSLHLEGLISAKIH